MASIPSRYRRCERMHGTKLSYSPHSHIFCIHLQHVGPTSSADASVLSVLVTKASSHALSVEPAESAEYRVMTLSISLFTSSGNAFAARHCNGRGLNSGGGIVISGMSGSEPDESVFVTVALVSAALEHRNTLSSTFADVSITTKGSLRGKRSSGMAARGAKWRRNFTRNLVPEVIKFRSY